MGLRLRLALGQRKSLSTVLLGSFLAFCVVVMLLRKMPAEHAYEQLSETDAKKYESAEVQELFPGKCAIKNFDTLRRMSIVYTWVNGSQPCYREMRQQHGGKQAIGGSRDREIGELMYSIRSFKKFVPWHIVSRLPSSSHTMQKRPVMLTSHVCLMVISYYRARSTLSRLATFRTGWI